MERRAVRLIGVVLAATVVVAGCSATVSGHAQPGNGTAAGGAPGNNASGPPGSGASGGAGNETEYIRVDPCSFVSKGAWDSLGKKVQVDIGDNTYDDCPFEITSSGPPAKSWTVTLSVGATLASAAEFVPTYGPVQTTQQSGTTVYTSDKDKYQDCLRAFNLPDGGPTMVIEVNGATDGCRAADLTLHSVLESSAKHTWTNVDPPLPANAAASTDLCQKLDSAVEPIVGASAKRTRYGARGCLWKLGQGQVKEGVTLALTVDQWPPPALTSPGAKSGSIGSDKTVIGSVPNPNGPAVAYAAIDLGEALVGQSKRYDVITFGVALQKSSATVTQNATALLQAVAALNLK